MGTSDSGPQAHRAVPRTALGGRTAWVVLTVGQFAAVVAVLQRSSLGVATTDALARFGITAATLAAFSMVQLLVYAALQVPVGVLIDRYGSKRLIVAGLADHGGCADDVRVRRDRCPLAFAARVVLGIGDALMFISVMRLVPAWFPARAQREAHQRDRDRSTSSGSSLSAVGFAAVLAAVGWTPSFLSAAAVSVASAVLALLLLRDSPLGRPPRVPLARRRSPRPATASARRGRNRAPGSGSGWGSWPCSPA